VTLHVINAHEGYPDSRFLFSLGAYGGTNVLVVGRESYEDALDDVFDWVAEHEPGLLADEEVQEEFVRLCEQAGLDPKQNDWSDEFARCLEEAEVDTMRGGNSGHYMHSWELWFEDRPSRETLKELAIDGVRVY